MKNDIFFLFLQDSFDFDSFLTYHITNTDQKLVRELISRSRSNDRVTFAQLISEYQEMVFRLLSYEEEARDLVQ